jgi:hypothetical protein
MQGEDTAFGSQRRPVGHAFPKKPVPLGAGVVTVLLRGMAPISRGGLSVVVTEDDLEADFRTGRHEWVELRHRTGIIQALVDPIHSHTVESHCSHRGHMVAQTRKRPRQLHPSPDNIHAVQTDTGQAHRAAITSNDLVAPNAEKAGGEQKRAGGDARCGPGGVHEGFTSERILDRQFSVFMPM